MYFYLDAVDSYRNLRETVENFERNPSTNRIKKGRFIRGKRFVDSRHCLGGFSSRSRVPFVHPEDGGKNTSKVKVCSKVVSIIFLVLFIPTLGQ